MAAAGTVLDWEVNVSGWRIKTIAEPELICYPKNMAKLSNITPWIERMLHGDAPRARSIVQIGRKGKLFATGGRGPGSPDMGPRDAAFATLLALYDGPPTECGPAVQTLADLPLAKVEVYPDGPREPTRIRLSGDDARQSTILLPTHFEGCPATLLEALVMIYARPTTPYHLDSLRIVSNSVGIFAFLTLFDLERAVASNLGSERDFFQIDMEFRKLTYTAELPKPGRESEYRFSGVELRELYCLIHGLDPEEDH